MPWVLNPLPTPRHPLPPCLPMVPTGRCRSAAKTHLELVPGGACVAIPTNVTCYVVTVLPKHGFCLRFESLVKRLITFRAKHPDWTVEDLRQKARELGFLNRKGSPIRENPLHWFQKKANQDLVIVLPTILTGMQR